MKKIFLFGAAIAMSVSLSAQFGYNVVFTENDYNNPNTVVENGNGKGYGDNAWDNGIRLGGTDESISLWETPIPAWDWDSKHIVIKLAAGIPDTLFFTCKENKTGTFGSTGMGFRVRQGATLETLERILIDGQDDQPGLCGTNPTSYAVALESTTRFISLDWGGNFSGTYTNVYVTPATTYGSYEAQYCEGDSVEFLGKYYTAGEYEVKTVNYFGGDSIITLTVVENPAYLETEDKTMYVGKDSVWRGQDLSVYPVGEHVVADSLQTVAGCDSVFLLYLTVNALPTTFGEDSAVICAGDSVEYHEQFYQGGVHEVTLVNWIGGDSIVTFTVYELPVYDTLIVDTMRVGQKKVYYEDREYTADSVGEFLIDTVYLQTVAGCDSTLYFKMVVLADPAAINRVRVEATKAKRVLVDGKLVIICDDKIYNALGTEIR